eukprot:10634268-Heterocapsa_arctica.AAC.1
MTVEFWDFPGGGCWGWIPICCSVDPSVRVITDVGTGLLIPFPMLGAELEIRGLIIVAACWRHRDGCGFGSSCCGCCPTL